MRVKIQRNDKEETLMERPHQVPQINGDFFHKHIISFDQFDPESLAIIFGITGQMRDVAKNAMSLQILGGNLATLLFYEPSSRTMGSFDAAMKQLGGGTIVIQNPQQFSSVAKGESFPDSIRTFGAFCDAIVLRHPEKGSALKASQIVERVRVAKHAIIINAGDGIGEHPTQTLLDLFTIQERTRSLNGLKGLVAGDPRNGRTVHSLLRGLSLYRDNTIYLLSPEQLRLSAEDHNMFVGKGLKLVTISHVEEIPGDCDFWYWTRVQKERFSNPAEYDLVNNKFVVTKEVLETFAGKQTILMHPLPRVGEIAEEVDDDPRAVYLEEQVRNGMYVRMALLGLVLGKIKP